MLSHVADGEGPLLERRVQDWDNAYANSANIAGSERWPAAWFEAAQSFRNRLATEARAKLDIAYGSGTDTDINRQKTCGTPHDFH